MKRISFTFLIIALFLPPYPTAGADKSLTAQVETFLNGIRCLIAEFIQTNPDHSQSIGKIWLKREKKCTGKMRLDYSSEMGQRLLVREGELIVCDLKDGSESRYTLDYTPAAFILKHSIILGKDVIVDSIKRDNNFIEVVLTPKGDATGQSLTLYFSLYETGNIKNLEQWVVQDPQGNQTLVQFIPDKMVLNDPKLVPEDIFKP